MSSDAVRLFDGRASDLPGWTIDRYGPIALIQHFGRDDADPELLAKFVADLLSRADVEAVVLKERGHANRSRGEGRLVGGILPERCSTDPLAERRGRVVIEEDGLRFGADLLYGTNTGLFLDARPMRALVREKAADRRVLNLFSYTSGFGVAAMKGGAASATNVDIVPSALERGRVNYSLNGLAADTRSHARSDVFEFLRRASKRGTTWDLVICDPPPVPTVGSRKRRGGGFDPRQDMGKVLRLAWSVVAPGGGLLAMSAVRGRERFEDVLRRVLEEDALDVTPQRIDRAPEFPGAEGLRGYWIEKPAS